MRGNMPRHLEALLIDHTDSTGKRKLSGDIFWTVWFLLRHFLVSTDPDDRIGRGVTKGSTKLSAPLTLGNHQMPGVWRTMLPEDLQFLRYPSECESSCDACPKVKEENFHPDVRCCSYHPRVPNFLLGFALNDPETAPLVEKMIAHRLATPEGMQSSPVQLRKSLEQMLAPHATGEAPVVCGFLDANARRCGIYKYRDSVCATFFCKHDQKDDGEEFWRSLQSLAGQCEAALSQLVMADLGLDVDGYVAAFDSLAATMPALLAQQTEEWPTEVLQLLWKQWSGREAEFYRACADRVRALDDDLEAKLNSWPIRSPRLYDAAFRDCMPPELQRQMRKDGFRDGTPVPISDLWYQFKLVHRNLWR